MGREGGESLVQESSSLTLEELGIARRELASVSQKLESMFEKLLMDKGQSGFTNSIVGGRIPITNILNELDRMIITEVCKPKGELRVDSVTAYVTPKLDSETIVTDRRGDKRILGERADT